METHYALPLQDKPERKHLYGWIDLEEDYVTDKFDDQRDGHDESIIAHDIDEFWSRQIIQYIDRARAFLHGAEHADSSEAKRELEMRAQQAMAKCMMTAKGCVESMIRVYGPMPKPGVSSGTVEYWD